MRIPRYIPVFALFAVVVAIQLLTLATGKAFYLTQLTMTPIIHSSRSASAC